MKLQYIINLVFLLILNFMISTSCTKSDKLNEGEGINLAFEINGLVNDGQPIEILASNGKTSHISAKNLLKAQKRTNFNGLEVEYDIYEASISNDQELTKTASKNINFKDKYASSSPLAPGVTYRVLVYDASGGFVGSVDGNSGTLASSVPVEYNKNYTWYAYSFNTIDPLPALANTSDPQIYALPTLGVLYASGQVTPTVLGDNKVIVLFERRLSWIELIIDSRGTFAPIMPEGTKITTSNLTQSIFKIKSNTYVNPQPALGTIQGSSLVQLDPSTTKDSVYVANLYLSDDGRNDDFQINLESIKLQLDYSTNPSTGNATRTFANVPYVFDFVPESGKRYKIHIRLIESGVDIGGTKWARGNLHYTWGDNGFRFRHSGTYPYTSKFYPWIYTNTPSDYYFNGMTPPWTGNDNYSDFINRPVEFWNFNTVVPYAGDQLYDTRKIYNYTANDSYLVNPYVGKGYFYESISGYGPEYYASVPSGDPCSLVYPAGKWRLPTKSEAENLITNLQSNTGKEVYTDNTNNYYVGIFPYTTSTPDVYGNKIEFPFSGSITTAAGWTSGGWGPGYPSDYLGGNGDPRFAYERTNSFYWNDESPDDTEKSAYMMYWTSTGGSTNTNYNGAFPYGWAFAMKIKDGNFVDPVSGVYPNTIGGYPTSTAGYSPGTPPIREAYQGDGLNIRCVRAM